jgi:hypothetical protein
MTIINLSLRAKRSVSYLTNIYRFTMIGIGWPCGIIQRRLNGVATTQEALGTVALTLAIGWVAGGCGGALLECSERQVWRLPKAFRVDGAAGLVFQEARPAVQPRDGRRQHAPRRGGSYRRATDRAKLATAPAVFRSGARPDISISSGQ